MTHTPGPWKESHDPSPDWTGDWYIYGGPRRNRFIVQGEGWSDEEKANVRLIVAAPDLLEALKASLGAVEFMAGAIDADPEDHENLALALKAIRKTEKQEIENV